MRHSTDKGGRAADQLRVPRFTGVQVLHTESVEYSRGGGSGKRRTNRLEEVNGFGTRLEQNSTTNGRLGGGCAATSSQFEGIGSVHLDNRTKTLVF